MASLLKPAEKQTAYLKAGILGFAGSGKTFTASDIAIGLSAMLGKKKPVAFFDTETGSDYVVDRFKKKGVELLVAKTRAFTDLLEVVKDSEQSCDVLIIDSITHVWQELLEAYQKKHNVARLQFQHWGPIKGEWRRFTDAYLCSKVHIIMCGRAAWEYDYETNEDGKKDLIKTGTKMRAETDMGYEPSLLLEMERVKIDNADKKRKGSTLVHRCHILKDRTDLMNGQIVDNPTFKNFLPIIKTLNIGGEHFVLDTSRSSDIKGADYSYEDKRRLQKIYTEEIEGDLVSTFPGQAKEEKKAKADILQAVFNTRSWTAICDFHPDQLKDGKEKIAYLCKKIQAATVADGFPTPDGFMGWVIDALKERELMMEGPDDNIPDFSMTGEPKQENLV